MLSEAKDTSELMVDLAYAALFFGDAGMADEVDELEERLERPRARRCARCACSPPARRATPRRCRACCTCSRPSSAWATPPSTSPASSPTASASRPRSSPTSRPPRRSRTACASGPTRALAHRSLADVELPSRSGMRVVAIRRGKEWITDPDGDEMLLPGDVLFLRGPPGGIAELRELAGAPEWRPPGTDDDPAILTDLDRAVDVLVEMKNISEVAIGLAYSALLFNDQGLAAEVSHLEDRLDEMRERLEVWVLRARGRAGRPVAAARAAAPRCARPRSSATPRSRWCGWSRRTRRCTRSSRWRSATADEVIVRVPVSPGSFLDGRTLAEAQLEIETGYYLLAIRRAGRYVYRPRGPVQLAGGRRADRIGPDEGGRASPSSAATACSRTTPPARSRSSGSTSDLTTGDRTARLRSRLAVRRRRQLLDVRDAADRPHRGRGAGARRARAGQRHRRAHQPHAVGEIVRANVFTRFNAILGADARGDPGGRADPGRDRSASILVANSAIGIVQEVRAKRTLDQLAVLNASAARVRARRRRARGRRRGGGARRPARAARRRPDPVRRRRAHRGRARGRRVAPHRRERRRSTRHAGDEVLSGSFVVAGCGPVPGDPGRRRLLRAPSSPPRPAGSSSRAPS